jgi:5-methyltetrahydrofolate corrinoid/iron sulfur protein methyltransferase
MLIIANNITTRNPRIARIFQERIEDNMEPENCPGLRDVAESCVRAGANVLEINLQQHYDRPEMMEFGVKALQHVADRQLCLSSDIAATLEAGLKICRRPPIINFVAINASRLQEILPLAARYGTELVLLISDPASPDDARQMLEKAAILVGAANSSGIPNDRIILDPGIFHVTKEPGQRHLVEVIEVLRAVPETFEPPVRTTCWLSNSSAGAPARLRPVIETSLLAMLSGLGLSSVFLDILRPENKRAIRLLKIFHNEEVYADSELALSSREL